MKPGGGIGAEVFIDRVGTMEGANELDDTENPR
jgi:hypothetical protein